MTNVPNELRDMWADVYRLFDIHYLMEDTEPAWAGFLDKARELWERYNRNHRLMCMINVVIDMIDDRIKAGRTANAEGSVAQ